MKIILALIFGLAFLGCSDEPNVGSHEMDLWKKEIENTELAFSQLAGEEGIHEAFTTYAAADAVLSRNKKLIFGKIAIDNFYTSNSSTGLSWKLDFVDVATSGDLGYTYGHYIYTYQDSLGLVKADTGIFHTVWKRQLDGQWKFVWD